MSPLTIRRQRVSGLVKAGTEVLALQEAATVLGTSGPYTGPVVWGADEAFTDPSAPSWSALKTNTEAAGGTLNGLRSYHRQSSSPGLGATDISRHNAGALLALHMRTDVGVPDSSKAWATIAAGTYDASVYDPLLLAMCNLNYGDGGFGHAPTHSIFTLDSEFDRLQTPKGGAHGTAAEFVAAWRHLYDRFRTTGPNASHPNNSKVLFGWCPASFGLRVTIGSVLLPEPGLGSDRARPCYPGDNYVDILAPDAYNKLAEWPNNTAGQAYYGPQWHSMARLFQDMERWSQNTGLGIGKQIMIMEGDCQGWGTLTANDGVIGNGLGPYPGGDSGGSTNDGGTHKAAWFTDGATAMVANPLWKGFLYWVDAYGPYTHNNAVNTTVRTGWETAAATVRASLP